MVAAKVRTLPPRTATTTITTSATAAATATIASTQLMEQILCARAPQDAELVLLLQNVKEL